MHILIADDEPISRTMLAATLRKWGHDVTLAEDGASAWQMIQDVNPGLAILDWMMPGMDGTDVCRRIREVPAHAHMYVLLLTSRNERRDLISGLDAGANDYIIKPFDPDELRARLNVGIRLLDASVETERLLASIASILIGVDGEGRITRLNSAAHDTLGLASTAMGQPLTACGIAWADPQAVAAILHERERWPRAGELRFRNAAGIERLLGVTVSPLEQGTTNRGGCVILASDITDRRLMEGQLRQAQKLEGIGQLAAGIAHEINTPMQYIGDNVRFLGESVTGLEAVFARMIDVCEKRAAGAAPADIDAALAAMAREVEGADLEFLRRNLPDAVAQSLEGVEQVSRIVKAMKEFSHPGSGDKVPVDINHAIETTLVVARNETKYVADVVTELDPGLPRVPCLPGEVNQVLLNLVVNAAHAVGDAVAATPGARGRITVSTHAAGDGVEIRIADTGRGIPEQIKSRVFEPFFTTKEVGRGTGQGLALAHVTIVGRHGGRIWFESTTGQGTTFHIQLPTAACEGQVAVPAALVRA